MLSTAWLSIRDNQTPLAQKAMAALRLNQIYSIGQIILRIFAPTYEEKKALQGRVQEFNREWKQFKAKRKRDEDAVNAAFEFAVELKQGYPSIAIDLFNTMLHFKITDEMRYEVNYHKAILMDSSRVVPVLKKLDVKVPTEPRHLEIKFYLAKNLNRFSLSRFQEIINHPLTDPEIRARARYIVAKNGGGGIRAILDDPNVSARTKTKAERRYRLTTSGIDFDENVRYFLRLLEEPGDKQDRLHYELALCIEHRYPAIANELFRQLSLGASEKLRKLATGKLMICAAEQDLPSYPYLQAIALYLKAGQSEPEEAKALYRQVEGDLAAYENLRRQASVQLAVLTGDIAQLERLFKTEELPRYLRDECHYQIGISLKETDPNRAYTHFESNFRLKNTDRYKYERADLLRFMNPDEAIQLCESLEQNPDLRIKAKLLTGRIYASLDIRNEAVIIYKDLIQTAEPDTLEHAMARFHLCYSSKNDEALPELQSIVETPRIPEEVRQRALMLGARLRGDLQSLRAFLSTGRPLTKEIERLTKWYLIQIIGASDPVEVFKLCIEQLDQGDPQFFQRAWALLTQMGGERRKGGAEALLADPEASDGMKYWTRFLLASLGTDRIADFQSFMDDENTPAPIRSTATFFVRYSQTNSVSEKFNLCHDTLNINEIPFLFKAVIRGLWGRLGFPASFFKAIQDTRCCWPIQHEILTEFLKAGMSANSNVMQELMKMVKHPHAKIEHRDCAAIEIGKNGRLNRLRFLQSYLKGTDFDETPKLELRWVYAKRLGEVNPQVGIEYLKGILSSAQLTVEEEAKTNRIIAHLLEESPTLIIDKVIR